MAAGPSAYRPLELAAAKSTAVLAYWWLALAGALALLAMAAGAVVVWWLGPRAPAIGSMPRLQAPDFQFHVYASGPVPGNDEVRHLSDLKGKPLALVFWAGRCASCGDVLSALEDVQKRSEGRLAVLAVDVGRPFRTGTRRQAEQLLSELEVTYLAGHVEDKASVGEYELRRLPTLVFLDSQGRTFHRWEGAIGLGDLREIVGALLRSERDGLSGG
ncbi:MAG: TlpA family protein disulfide reductase [SAR202 cluster bacterium]|nr:TlpA family protein disulfide reductase [SAR202 cluster bacterium]